MEDTRWDCEDVQVANVVICVICGRNPQVRLFKRAKRLGDVDGDQEIGEEVAPCEGRDCFDHCVPIRQCSVQNPRGAVHAVDHEQSTRSAGSIHRAWREGLRRFVADVWGWRQPLLQASHFDGNVGIV